MSLTERDYTENTASRHHFLRKNWLEVKIVEKQAKSSFQKQQNNNKNFIYWKARILNFIHWKAKIPD